MNSVNDIKSVYFIGIGGIGMSAVARHFSTAGIPVAGYDRISSPLTDSLAREGMKIHFTDDVSAIPPEFKNPKQTLVVYTPAVISAHHELSWFRENNFTVKKRSEVLGLIVRDKKTIAVAGTHGKTTISSMITHLLGSGGIEAGAFLGGISKNLGSNFRYAGPEQYVVVEADEYDRSFLSLYPQIAVITAIDADHLDIYGDRENLKQAFGEFTSHIRDGGILVMKEGLDLPVPDNLKVYRYSLEEGSGFGARQIKRDGFRYRFDLKTPQSVLENFLLGVYGRVNLENAIAACAVSWLCGLQPDRMREALKTYSGVARRFDVRIESGNRVFIDDYAHHPEELRAFIASVKEALPEKRLTGIFQPHLYSRTRDFADDFARSLSVLDDVIILDIYPAREDPIPGVGPHLIFDKLTNAGERIQCSKEQLLRVVDELDPPVLLTMGAGDIDRMVEPIANLLEEKNQ